MTLITDQFKSLANKTAEEHGLPSLNIVRLPDRTDLSSEGEIGEITEEYFPEIISKLSSKGE